MENNENQPMKKDYPYKSFALFLALYLASLATYYPTLVAQGEVYVDIFGDSFVYTPNQFAAVALIQPVLLGVLAIYFGHRFARRVGLRSLVSEKIEKKTRLLDDRPKYSFKESLKFVFLFALILAVLRMSLDAFINLNVLGHQELTLPSLDITSILSSIFYNGFSQEILLRWGVMTSLVFVISSKGKELQKSHYWIGIAFTAVLYAFSQANLLPRSGDGVLFFWLRHFVSNGLDGLLYGWLFAKYHFEAAAVSHMLTNAFVIIGTVLLASFIG